MQLYYMMKIFKSVGMALWFVCINGASKVQADMNTTTVALNQQRKKQQQTFLNIIQLYGILKALKIELYLS